jgi:hypothetical protein
MKPVLYRYRDSESVIKPMEGYTPGEGWEPLYDQAEIDANIAAERERCAKVCDAIAYEWRGANSQSVQCANAIRKGE